MKTKRFEFLCVLILLFPACGSDREGDDATGLSSSFKAEETSPEGRYIYATRTAFSQSIIWNGQPFRPRDVIKRQQGFEDILIRSGNIEDSGSKEYALAACALKKIGLTLSRSRNGVYWGKWTNANDTLDAATYTWSTIGWRTVAYTIINERYIGLSNGSCQTESWKFSSFLITMYHEIKGHNIDNANHEDARSSDDFDKKYEDPVFVGLHKHGTCKVFNECIAELNP